MDSNYSDSFDSISEHNDAKVPEKEEKQDAKSDYSENFDSEPSVREDDSPKEDLTEEVLPLEKNPDLSSKRTKQVSEDYFLEPENITYFDNDPSVKQPHKRFKSVPSKSRKQKQPRVPVINSPSQTKKHIRVPHFSTGSRSIVSSDWNEILEEIQSSPLKARTYIKNLEKENKELREQLKNLNHQLSSILDKLSVTYRPKPTVDLTQTKLKNVQKLAQIEEYDHGKVRSAYAKIGSDTYSILFKQVNALKEKLKQTEKLNQQLNNKLKPKKAKSFAQDEYVPFKFIELSNDRNLLAEKLEKLEQKTQKSQDSLGYYQEEEKKLQQKYENLVKIAMNKNTSLKRKSRLTNRNFKLRNEYKNKEKEFYVKMKSADSNIKALEYRETQLLKEIEENHKDSEEYLENLQKAQQDFEQMTSEVDKLKLLLNKREEKEKRQTQEAIFLTNIDEEINRFKADDEDSIKSFSELKNITEKMYNDDNASEKYEHSSKSDELEDMPSDFLGDSSQRYQDVNFDLSNSPQDKQKKRDEDIESDYSLLEESDKSSSHSADKE